jgi:hypothetical protein
MRPRNGDQKMQDRLLPLPLFHRMRGVRQISNPYLLVP